MALIRKCEDCGASDRRASWKTAEDAAKQGAFDNWTCPMCAWPEFDLVEGEEEPATA